jgi:hypothetical protein
MHLISAALRSRPWYALRDDIARSACQYPPERAALEPHHIIVSQFKRMGEGMGGRLTDE